MIFRIFDFVFVDNVRIGKHPLIPPLQLVWLEGFNQRPGAVGGCDQVDLPRLQIRSRYAGVNCQTNGETFF